MCALVGPSGAGKSSLPATAAGPVPPTEGTLRTAPREELAYVGQEKPLYPQLTVDETLCLAVTGLLTGLVHPALGPLRWSFLPVETNSIPFAGNPAEPLPRDSLLMDMGLLTASGSRLPDQACFERTRNMGVCPASHYWPTQLIETAVVLALAAAVLYAAFRVLRARRG
ncbi:ATP-binding cassette domain-containing protein [Streptomyces sp. NPDC127110]|uniref:ATP-binding cassette domain-containing protein n=1 Tax=Streptomyces sp. NPDC127110 TaxID=3345362 RepID=UPI00363FF424